MSEAVDVRAEWTGEPSGPFSRLSLSAFCRSGGPLVQRVKQLLFEDRHALDLLPGKGLLAPDRREVLQLWRWDRLLDAAAAECDASDPASSIARRFLRLLGLAPDQVRGIPSAAFHTGAYAEPVLGQNRIGYMPMGNVDFRHGLMLGGIGTGGIERTPEGSFRRFGMTCTTSNVEDLHGDTAATQFHLYLDDGQKRVATALCVERPPQPRLASFLYALRPEDASYHALYPREWFVYGGADWPAKVTIRAFSPVLPHNYRESSYPVVVYRACIENTGPRPLRAALAFTFQNLVGWLPNSKAAAATAENVRVDRRETCGVRPLFEPALAWDRRSGWHADSRGSLNRAVHGADDVALLFERRGPRRGEADGQIALCLARCSDTQVTVLSAFDAFGDGSDLSSFYERGTLADSTREYPNGTHLAGGLCSTAPAIPAHSAVHCVFALAYDFPYSQQGTKLCPKRYTEFFGAGGESALDIARTALRQASRWEREVEDFQAGILSRRDIPAWAQGALVNKLNLLQTTSLGWLRSPSVETRLDPERQAENDVGLLLLAEANKDDYECAETLDVTGYGMARLLFWPKLEDAVLDRFARSVGELDATPTHFHCSDERPELFDAALRGLEAAVVREPPGTARELRRAELDWFLACIVGPRKERGAVPHDLWSCRHGERYNAYTYQNANRWPDLAARAMLQACRNHAVTGDGATLGRQYMPFARAMRWALERFDADCDSIPDFLIGPVKADPRIKVSLWTFDNLTWTWKDGINACSGGLWVVATAAAERAAAVLELPSEREFWKARRRAAMLAYDRALWSEPERRYRLGPKRREVFADCLHFFYDKILGLALFEQSKVVATLEAIYAENVRSFGDGYCGAVNATLGGEPLPGEQTNEVWTGTSFILGLTMLAYGLDQGWNVLYGTEALTTHRSGHFADWAEAYTLEPGVGGIAAYGMRAKNYLRCLSLVNLLAVRGAPLE